MAIVDNAFREWIADFKATNPGVADSRAILDTAQYAFAAGRKAQREIDAARQPAGELHLPPDGFYKIVFDDAEVPDESFARSGALDAALRRFEQISNKWNAHLFVRFANNTRDCTVPNATPAQAVDLGQFNALAALANAVVHHGDESPMKNGLFAEAERLLALIDGKAVGK